MIRLALLFTVCLSQSVAAHGGCSFLRTAYTDLGHDGAECKEIQIMGGGTRTICQWQFAYRAQKATEFYDHVVSDLAACMTLDASKDQDDGVNHPDSYTVQHYSGSGLASSVSLKDKAQMNATFVSVTLGGR